MILIGNARKKEKHGVTASEAEQVFFNQPLLMLDDAKHSQAGRHFHALGMSHTEQSNGPGSKQTGQARNIN